MSRAQLATQLDTVAKNPTITPGQSRALVLVARMLRGGWTPPKVRPNGYRCLGYDRLNDKWHQVTWVGQQWFMGNHPVFPEAFAPLPFATEQRDV